MKRKRTAKARVGSRRAVTNLGRIVRQQLTNYEEKKYVPFVPMQQLIPDTWLVKNLLNGTAVIPTVTQIKQGTAAYERVGNKIKLQGIDICIRVRPNNTSMDTNGSMCRFVVVHSKNSNGVAPSLTELFVSDDINALQNPIYEHRLTFHNDWVHSMVRTTSTDSGPEGLYKIHVPARSIIEFNGSTGADEAIIKDCWYLVSRATEDECCNVFSQCVVRYIDA